MSWLLCTLFFLLPGGKPEPIKTGIFFVRYPVTEENLYYAIYDALVAREWTILKEEKGHILAMHQRGPFQATIHITYTTKKVTLEYVDSKNLLTEENGQKLIHRTYNNWVERLTQNIDYHLD